MRRVRIFEDNYEIMQIASSNPLVEFKIWSEKAYNDSVDEIRISLMSMRHNQSFERNIVKLENQNNICGFLSKKLFIDYFGSTTVVIDKNRFNTHLDYLKKIGFEISSKLIHDTEEIVISANLTVEIARRL